MTINSSNERLLNVFNLALSELKEEFHKTGRYDDVNTKLDEILKLLVIKYIDTRITLIP